jgi:hypothetical protein
MKRISSISRNEASDNESDDANTRNDKRSRRRLQSLEESTSNSEPAVTASTIDDLQSDDAKNESYASLLTRHQDSQHSIENLDENDRLPEYVKVHTNTLTFPEKVSFLCYIQDNSSLVSQHVSIAYDNTHPC